MGGERLWMVKDRRGDSEAGRNVKQEGVMITMAMTKM